MLFLCFSCLFYSFLILKNFPTKKLICLLSLEISTVFMICGYLCVGHFSSTSFMYCLFMSTLMVSGSVLGVSLMVSFCRSSWLYPSSYLI